MKSNLSAENKKSVEVFKREIEKGVAECYKNFYRPDGSIESGFTTQDVSKKLKEVYSIAWNRFAKENGLDGLILETDCKLKTQSINAFKLFNQLDKTWDSKELKDTLKTFKKQSMELGSKEFEESYQRLEKLIGNIKLKDSASEEIREFLAKLQKDLEDQHNLIKGDNYRDGLEKKLDVLEALNALAELTDVDLKTADNKAIISLKSLLSIGRKIDEITGNLVLEEEIDDLYLDKKSDDHDHDVRKRGGDIKAHKDKLIKQTTTQMLVLGAITVACAAIAAVLLSEVLVGVALGGGVSAAVSSFITTQAPALGALIGVAIPAETLQISLGAIAAATSLGGIKGILDTKSYDLDNIALNAAVRENVGVTAVTNQIGDKLAGMMEAIEQYKSNDKQR